MSTHADGPLPKDKVIKEAPAKVPADSGVKLAEEFLAYCKCNPELRFWQALLSWSGLTRIMEVTGSISGIPIRHLEMKDTFYWVGKNK